MTIGSFILGFVSAIAVTFIGALFSYVFSENQRRRDAFNKAAIEFQCAFLEAKQKLRDDPSAEWSSILNSEVLLEHEKAYMRFKLFLTPKQRYFFDLDWNTYFTHRLHPGDRQQPEKAAEEWDNEENCKKFIAQIEQLLSHAKLR